MKTSKKQEMRYEKVIIVINFIIYGGYSKRLQWIWCNRYHNQDPYDLYSWDSETGTYIPYQQAEGNGEPIGRGNGWYYYAEEAEAYIPW